MPCPLPKLPLSPLTAFAAQGCLSKAAAALLPANLVGLIGSLLTVNGPRLTVEQALQQRPAAAPAQLAVSGASALEGDGRQAGGHAPLEQGAHADSTVSAALLPAHPSAGVTAGLGEQAQTHGQQFEGTGAAGDGQACPAWASELVAVPRVVLAGLSLVAAGRLGRPDLAATGLDQPYMGLSGLGQPRTAAAGRPAAVGQAGQQPVQAGQQPVQAAHEQPGGAAGNLGGTSALPATRQPVSRAGVHSYQEERQRRIEVRAELLLCVSPATAVQHLVVWM